MRSQEDVCRCENNTKEFTPAFGGGTHERDKEEWGINMGIHPYLSE